MQPRIRRPHHYQQCLQKLLARGRWFPRCLLVLAAIPVVWYATTEPSQQPHRGGVSLAVPSPVVVEMKKMEAPLRRRKEAVAAVQTPPPNNPLPPPQPPASTPEGLSRGIGDALPPTTTTTVKLKTNNHQNRLMVIPEHKLLFCYVEKVGCSMFNQLFRMLRLYHPNQTSAEREWLAASHFGRANPNHFGMSLSDLTRLVRDDTWTKAVFWRDPADRYLSGFKSKCGGADSDGGRSCGHAFGTHPLPPNATTNTNSNQKQPKPQPLLGGSTADFRTSIDIVSNATDHVFKNSHFRPATKFCGGLDASLGSYQFVQKLDKRTVAGHVKTLFDHLGVDPSLTEGLVERVVATGGILHPHDHAYAQRTWGLRLRGNISDTHSTSSTKQKKTTAKQYFGDAATLRKLQEVYRQDYDLFRLAPPSFESLH